MATLINTLWQGCGTKAALEIGRISFIASFGLGLLLFLAIHIVDTSFVFRS